MSRTTVNFLLDTSLLVAFAVLVYSSVIVRFVFPPALDSRGWQLWGLSFDQWVSVQFSMIAVMALAVLVHVMLHWSWVCGFLAARLARNKGKLDNGTQTIYGVGLLIFVLNALGLAIAVAALSIQHPH